MVLQLVKKMLRDVDFSTQCACLTDRQIDRSAVTYTMVE